MPTTLTRSSGLFPPQTREVQFDEKRSFVAKKPKPCEAHVAADVQKGDWWDHIAYDPEHRLVLGVVPGRGRSRTPRRSSPRPRGGATASRRGLMTRDEYRACVAAIDAAFGVRVTAAKASSGRPRIMPKRRLPKGLAYVTVHLEGEAVRGVLRARFSPRPFDVRPSALPPAEPGRSRFAESEPVPGGGR